MTVDLLDKDTEPLLEYQIFALSFQVDGAISNFRENLPPFMVGTIHGNTGINEFYQALIDFHEQTKLDIVNPIAFKTWLESETEIVDALGGMSGISTFLDIIFNLELSDADSVIKVLKGKYNKRKQLDFVQELQTLLQNKSHKSDEDRAKITSLTDQIHALEQDLDYNPLETITTANDISSHADQLMKLPDFLSTPFKALNRAMSYTDEGGFFRGAVHAVIAESGKGKSTFCKNLVNHWADEGYKTLYINFEEARDHWETVLFTQVIKENVYANADNWSVLERADRLETFRDKLGNWGDNFMVKHDPDTSYFSDLEKWLRDIMGHPDCIPDVVVIDTIQSLVEKGKGARWAEFEFMMIRLEKLARDMNAVFIITAQQNSNAAKEKREVIQQSDTGGSLVIQQKSSVTIFITEKKMSGQEDDVDERLMQLQIPKNRITGASFTYDPPMVLYIDEWKSYIDLPEGGNMQKYDAESINLDTFSSFEDFN